MSLESIRGILSNGPVMIKHSPVNKFRVIKNEGRKMDYERRDITRTRRGSLVAIIPSRLRNLYIIVPKDLLKNYLTDGSINVLLGDPDRVSFVIEI